MKKLTTCLLAICLMGVFSSCKKDTDPVPVPIAPLLKEIIFPNVNDVMPGRPAVIRGKGFAPEDKLFIEDDVAMTEVEVLGTSDQDIRFMVPANAGGSYTVTVERANLQTTLDGELVVPFVILLDDLVMPTQTFTTGSTVEIGGTGFEAGDLVVMTAAHYPENKTITVTPTLTAQGISFVVPADAYGVNNVILTRGALRKTILGTIGIEAHVGDEVGGGVVFYMETDKLHGFIVAKTNSGGPLEQFGPAVALSGAAGTSKGLGSGKINTNKLLAKIAAFRQSNSAWNNKKASFELCDELAVTVAGDTYTDWFLPSLDELTEVFRVKDMLATKNAGLPPNNYWTSSEGDGDAAGWSAFYVNFYEPVNVVTGNVDKEGWKIGVRAIRSF